MHEHGGVICKYAVFWIIDKYTDLGKNHTGPNLLAGPTVHRGGWARPHQRAHRPARRWVRQRARELGLLAARGPRAALGSLDAGRGSGSSSSRKGEAEEASRAAGSFAGVGTQRR